MIIFVKYFFLALNLFVLLAGKSIHFLSKTVIEF